MKDLSHTSTVKDELGIVVPPHHVTGFVQAASYLMESAHDTLDCMGSNGRKKAQGLYDWKNHVERIMNHKNL